MDATDRQLLALLQQDAQTTNADLARAVGMAPSAVLERVRKLEKQGIILGYEAKIDGNQVGLGLLAFVLIQSKEPPGAHSIATRMAQFDEVLEVHGVAGEDCYLAKVRVRDANQLMHFIREKLGAFEEITHTRTLIVLDTVKETLRLPLNLSTPS